MCNADESLFYKPELIMYQSDPKCFKSRLLNACTRSLGDTISHIEYAEANLPKRPIATMLKFIRPIVPDEIVPHKKELSEYLKKIEDKTMANFSLNYVDEEKIKARIRNYEKNKENND